MKAIIFDMDGVILDSELHWKKAEHTLFNQLMPKWTKEDQQVILGLNIHDCYRVLSNNYGLDMDHADFIKRVSGIAHEVYSKWANLLPDFLDLIKKIKIKQIPTALASSSLMEWIVTAMKRFDIEKYFDHIISIEGLDMPGKPAPDIYLYAAKKLGLNPADCLVIEDSTNGIKAAKSAGMYCVGLRNGFNEKQDHSIADVEANGFISLNNDKFFNLFK